MLPNVSDAIAAREAPTQVHPPPSVAPHRGNRTLATVAGLGAVLVVALGVGTIFALDLLGGGPSTQGGASPNPAPTQESPTTTEPHAVTDYATTAGSDEAAAAEAEVEEAVRDYYWAVDREDWSYTYDNLDSQTQVMFTKEEWYLKNQWFADHEGLELASMEVDVVIDLGGVGAEVTVRRTFEDGTSIDRDTYFVLEDGGWKHRFTEEEKEIFVPDASYEEFVAAQQGGSSDDVATESEGPSLDNQEVEGDYEITRFKDGTTTLDGSSPEYSFAYIYLVTDDQSVPNDLARYYVDKYGYDIVVIEGETATPDPVYGKQGIQDSAFGSIEAQQDYMSWRTQKTGEEAGEIVRNWGRE
jgi:hypothetical protein